MNICGMRGLVFALETCLRLGLLLQSGAPFDRSSKSWFVLVRLVGPDRSGTSATAETTVLRSSVVGVWYTFLRCTTDLTQQPRRPSSTVGRPICGQFRGVIYLSLPFLRLDVLVLPHSSTCISSRSSLHLSQPCSTFLAVVRKSSCGNAG